MLITDAGGLTRNVTQSITVTNTNDAPDTLSLSAGGSVAENSTNGAVVATFTGSDPDTGDTLTYSLTDDAGGRFAINATTGVVSVANGSLLDYESATSHSITVRITDAGGLTRDLTEAITLTNVNDAPASLALSGVSGASSYAGAIAFYNATFDKYYAFVTTNSTWEAAMDYAQISLYNGIYGTLVHLGSALEEAFLNTVTSNNAYWLGVSDKLVEGEWRWYQGDTPGSLLSLGAAPVGGAYHNWGASQPDNFWGAEHFAMANWNGAWNDVSGGSSTSSIIQWTGADVRAATPTVSEHATNGTIVATFTGTDPDTGDSLTYSLTDNAGGRFAINAATGVVSVADASLLTPGANVSITVRVTDTGGLTRDLTQTLQILDVADAPNAVSLTSGGAIAENAANGAIVATFTGTDPDAGDSLTYALIDNAGGRFTINATTGVVSVANGGLLNYEAATSHNITVRATDATGLTRDVTETITLTNVNETPSDLFVSSVNTSGNALTPVGNASLISGNEYQLTPDLGFNVGAAWGRVNLSSAVTWQTQLFFGTNDAGADGITFTLQPLGLGALGSDGHNLGSSGIPANTFGVYFTTYTSGGGGPDQTRFFRNGDFGDDAFSPPTDLPNLEDGTWHDVSFSWDPTTTTLSYSIDGGPAFSKVYDVVNQLFGGNPNVFFGFTAATGGSVNDHRVRLLSISNDSQSLLENAVNGTLVATFTGTDPDAGDTLTYSLTNNAGGRFAINAATGVVSVANSALLDYETATSHTITVRVTDLGGLTRDVTQVINLSNANDAPVTLNLSAGGTIAENSANGSIVATFTGTDPDAGDTLTYALTDNAGGRFAINASTGVVTVANASLLNYESATSHSISVSVTDAGGLSQNLTQSISLTDVSEAPNTLALTAGGSVAENATNGTVVATFTGTDADAGNTLTYSLTDNAGGRFAINTTTGVVSVANGALLDYETSTSHSITVRVTDNTGLTRDLNQTITLTNVNDPTTDIVTGRGVVVHSENFESGFTGWTNGAQVNGGGAFSNFLTDAASYNNNESPWNLGTYEQQAVYKTFNLSGNQSSITLEFDFFELNSWDDETFKIWVDDQEVSFQEFHHGDTESWHSDSTPTSDTSNKGFAGWGDQIHRYSLTINTTGTSVKLGFGSGLDEEWLNESWGIDNLVIRENRRGGLDTSGPPPSVNENASTGTMVTVIDAADQDTTETFTYSIVGGATNNFVLDNNVIRVKAGANINYESATSHQLDIQAVGSLGSSFTKTITIGVNDINEAPDNITLTSGGTIAENVADDTIVATFVGHDPDSGDTLTYYLDDDADGRFYIDSTTGVVRVADGSRLNYELEDVHTIRVTVEDSQGNWYEDEFDIHLTNVNEAPTEIRGVSDNTVRVAFEDFESGATGWTNGLTVDADSFTHLLTDGQTYNSDPWSAGVYDLQSVYKTFNLSGNQSSVTITVDVAEIDSWDGESFKIWVDDQLVSVTPFHNTDNETGVANMTNLTTPQNVVFNGWNDQLHRFTLTVSTTGNTLKLGFGSSLDQGWSDEAWGVDNITIEENHLVAVQGAANGTVIAQAVGVEPDSGDTLTYTLTNDAGGRFAINAATGEISVANTGLINFANATSHNITVRVTDAGGLTKDQTMTIKVDSGANDALTGDANANIFDGGAGNDTLSGLGGNDLLYGRDGNDTLDGGTGADTLVGGTGNDVYSVDNASDQITESSGQGTDTVQSSINFTLGANLEALTLSGGTATVGVGNGLDNTLVGNALDNTLTGMAGNDFLSGGAGNDTLIGDGANSGGPIGANLVANHSFEQDDMDGEDAIELNTPTGWTSLPGSDWVHQFSSDYLSQGFNNTGQFIDMAGDANGAFYQDLATTAGESYNQL